MVPQQWLEFIHFQEFFLVPTGKDWGRDFILRKITLFLQHSNNISVTGYNAKIAIFGTKNSRYYFPKKEVT